MQPTPTDTNLVVLVGTLTARPEVRHLASGARRADLTISVRDAGPPRRVDALPVVWWDPPPGTGALAPGTRVSVVGAVRRRFWATESGRQSRLEVHAGGVEFDEAGPVAT